MLPSLRLTSRCRRDWPRCLNSAPRTFSSSFRSHGYTQTTEPAYMLTIIDRGADLLAAAGSIGPDQAAALKSEARRRAKAGEFFGHISFVSVIARKLS